MRWRDQWISLRKILSLKNQPCRRRKIQDNNLVGDYVVTIGRASWVKGTWECIEMLTGTEIGLVHVGGGDQNDIKQLKELAKKNNVKFEVSKRLEHEELVQLLSSSLGVISLAHKEPFGLTPVEAHAVGVPALMVNEGGFSSTIVDGESGRLLPRNDYTCLLYTSDAADE